MSFSSSSPDDDVWTHQEIDRLLYYSGRLGDNWQEIDYKLQEEGFPERSIIEYKNQLKKQSGVVSKVVLWSSYETHLLCNIIRQFESQSSPHDDVPNDMDWTRIASTMHNQTGIQRSINAYKIKWRSIRNDCGHIPPIRIKIENEEGQVSNNQHHRPSLLNRPLPDEELTNEEKELEFIKKLPKEFSYTLCILGPDWYAQQLDPVEFKIQVNFNSWHKPRYFSPGEALYQLCINKEHRDEGQVENLWAWITGSREYLSTKNPGKRILRYPKQIIVFIVNPKHPDQLLHSNLQQETILPNPFSFEGVKSGAKNLSFSYERSISIVGRAHETNE